MPTCWLRSGRMGAARRLLIMEPGRCTSDVSLVARSKPTHAEATHSRRVGTTRHARRARQDQCAGSWTAHGRSRYESCGPDPDNIGQVSKKFATEYQVRAQQSGNFYTVAALDRNRPWRRHFLQLGAKRRFSL